MIGEVGVAIGDLDPEGRIFVHGEYWNAISSTPDSDGRPGTGAGGRPPQTGGRTGAG